MIFLMLGKALADFYNATYFTVKDHPIKKDIFLHRKFKMKFNEKTFEFSNGSKNYITDACAYTLVGKDSFGFLHVCNDFAGLICNKDECLEIHSIANNNPKKIVVNPYPLDKVEIDFPSLYSPEIVNDNQILIKSSNPIFRSGIRLINKKILKIRIALINEYDRYKQYGNYAYKDTLKIFKIARKILRSLKFNNFRIEIVKSIILSRTNSNILDIKDLKSPLDSLEVKIGNFKSINGKLINSDLTILLRNDRDNDKEGISYMKGVGDKETKFIIINFDDNDSVFYKAKVLVHEILHTLGSFHDKGSKGFLMDEKFLDKNDTKIQLSKQSKKDIEKFVNRNQDKLFKYTSDKRMH